LSLTNSRRFGTTNVYETSEKVSAKTFRIITNGIDLSARSHYTPVIAANFKIGVQIDRRDELVGILLDY